MRLHDDVQIGVEMTFVPDLPVPEFTRRRDAHIAANRLHKRIHSLNVQAATEHGVVFNVKVDPFRRGAGDEFRAWIIELDNGNHPPTVAMFETRAFKSILAGIYREAREIGLLPRIARRKGRNLVTFPTGGAHLHLGLSHLFSSANYLERLTAFEKALYVDYANRPYIKWLFAEWFDHGNNCRVGWKPAPWSCEDGVRREGIYDGTISPRFSGSNLKKILPTYEFRMFDLMPANATELCLNVRFLSAWMGYLRDGVLAGETIPLAINSGYFNSLKNLRTGWREVSTFLRLIGLEPRDYRAHFERSYVPRMKWGKMI